MRIINLNHLYQIRKKKDENPKRAFYKNER